MRLAAEAGVGTLAVTDHDTLDGLAEALVAGAAHGVRVIPGVELSIRAPSGSLHLLGYFREPSPSPLGARLADLRAARERRARRIVELLAAAGAPIPFEAVAARARGPIGRPHVADALVAAGHAADRQDAFERLIGHDGPAYVPHDGIGPEEAIALVRESGGAPVLAHPASLRMDGRSLAAYVRRLARAGLAGIEVHRPDHGPERRRAYARIARRLHLVAAGGSDFHRPGEELQVGDTGQPPLAPETVERLLG